MSVNFFIGVIILFVYSAVTYTFFSICICTKKRKVGFFKGILRIDGLTSPKAPNIQFSITAKNKFDRTDPMNRRLLFKMEMLNDYLKLNMFVLSCLLFHFKFPLSENISFLVHNDF